MAENLTPELLKVGDVARLSNASTRTICRWRDMGYLPPAIKIGGSIRWTRASILDWIANGCKPCRPVRKGGAR
jgi:predicted DNA-binding transcriptional regulator AlpA